MRTLLYFSILIIGIVGCKKDKSTPTPPIINKSLDPLHLTASINDTEKKYDISYSFVGLNTFQIYGRAGTGQEVLLRVDLDNSDDFPTYNRRLFPIRGYILNGGKYLIQSGGYLHLDTIIANEKKVKGTFYFSGINSSGQSLDVTNGGFNLNYRDTLNDKTYISGTNGATQSFNYTDNINFYSDDYNEFIIRVPKEISIEKHGSCSYKSESSTSCSVPTYSITDWKFYYHHKGDFSLSKTGSYNINGKFSAFELKTSY